MPARGESDMGVFSLSPRAAFDWLAEYARTIDLGDATGERNFLPFIAWAAARGTVATCEPLDAREAVGINTPDELEHLARWMRSRDRVPTLSIVIPAYNEEAFIGALLGLVQAVDLQPLGVDKDIVVVDDCSRDRTSAIASAVPGVRVHRMPVNGGKGKAVRAGIDLAIGDYLHHPGCRSRVRPAGLHSDGSCHPRRACAT